MVYNFSKWFKVPEAEFQSLKRTHCDMCTKCKGTRLLTIDTPEFTGVAQCECVKAFQSAYALAKAGIPIIYRSLTIKDIDPEFAKNNVEGMTKALKYWRLIQKAHDDGTGLFLNGDNGSGKSFVASLILKEALVNGFSAHFVLLKELTSAAFDALRDEDAREDLEALITQTDFLVIDEFDKMYQDKNEFVINLLDALFKQRYYTNKPLIITSNTPFEEIINTHSSSIASMFTEKLLQVCFTGNYRAKRGKDLEAEFFTE